MIAASPTLAEAMLSAVATAMAGGSVMLFASTRPAAGDSPATAALTTLVLPTPAGVVGTGALTLASSEEGQLLAAGSPVWARVYSSAGAWLFDCDARLTGDADTGQEIVLTAPAVYPGAFVRITGGTLSI